jgi:putative toxin of predicted polymorphic toxin system
VSYPDFELPSVELPFPVASMDPVPAGDPVAQDGGIVINPQAGVDEPPRYVSDQEIQQALSELKAHLAGVVSAGLNFVPGIGQLKGVVEAFAGQDLITGHHISWWERGLNLAAAIPHIHGAEGFVKAMGEVGHHAHSVNKIVHGSHGVSHANGVLDGVTGRTHD